jgi:hypothetical protein
VGPLGAPTAAARKTAQRRAEMRRRGVVPLAAALVESGTVPHAHQNVLQLPAASLATADERLRRWLLTLAAEAAASR